MSWSIRKSFRLLPGIRINVSKGGPRLSVGIRGARTSFGMDGKAKIYGGAGPLRYQKTVSIGLTPYSQPTDDGFLAVLRRLGRVFKTGRR
jgi:hypothetical protein